MASNVLREIEHVRFVVLARDDHDGMIAVGLDEGHHRRPGVGQFDLDGVHCNPVDGQSGSVLPSRSRQNQTSALPHRVPPMPSARRSARSMPAGCRRAANSCATSPTSSTTSSACPACRSTSRSRTFPCRFADSAFREPDRQATFGTDVSHELTKHLLSQLALQRLLADDADGSERAIAERRVAHADQRMNGGPRGARRAGLIYQQQIYEEIAEG